MAHSTQIRWNVSFDGRYGVRGVLGFKDRYMLDTFEEAVQHLNSLTNTPEDQIAKVFGRQAIGTFKVESYNCVVDPKMRLG